ncbi:MAG TPA: hypothetical protein VMX16_19870 [Terriglobia bacterium]|nr:hypothetical protein [Terriglobia bacterium]
MKRSIATVAAVLSLALIAVCAQAKQKEQKSGPLTGTWECTAHGGPQGDMSFTLSLEQTKSTVTGDVTSPLGDTEISSGNYKKKTLEIHIDSPEENYTLTAKYAHGKLQGQWKSDGGQGGAWEAHRSNKTADQ